MERKTRFGVKRDLAAPEDEVRRKSVASLDKFFAIGGQKVSKDSRRTWG